MKGALAAEANMAAPPSAAGRKGIAPTTTTDTIVALEDISIAPESGWRAIGAIGE